MLDNFSEGQDANQCSQLGCQTFPCSLNIITCFIVLEIHNSLLRWSTKYVTKDSNSYLLASNQKNSPKEGTIAASIATRGSITYNTKFAFISIIQTGNVFRHLVPFSHIPGSTSSLKYEANRKH